MREQVENEIRKVASGFVEAAELGSIEKMASFICAQGREDFLDSVNLNFEESEWEKVETTVSDIEIRGDFARAKVVGTSDNAKNIDGILFFRKEGGTWKTCADSANEWD